MFKKLIAAVKYFALGRLSDYDILMGFAPDTIEFNTKKEANMTRIVPVNDQYELFHNGQLVQSYSRARDARRGAARRGLQVA